MLLNYQYVKSSTESSGCPFCGGNDTSMTVAPYESALHHFYCNDCKVEFTVEERVADEERGSVRNLTTSEALARWDRRSKGASGDECPFCGNGIEEWPWGHYLFDSLWCPSCKMRFQFQSHGHSKASMRRTMREFARRPKNN